MTSVSVITREDIDRQKPQDLLDILQGEPGMEVRRSGGIGLSSSIFMRGANSNQVLVLVDGLNILDEFTNTRMGWVEIFTVWLRAWRRTSRILTTTRRIIFSTASWSRWPPSTILWSIKASLLGRNPFRPSNRLTRHMTTIRFRTRLCLFPPPTTMVSVLPLPLPALPITASASALIKTAQVTTASARLLTMVAANRTSLRRRRKPAFPLPTFPARRRC